MKYEQYKCRSSKDDFRPNISMALACRNDAAIASSISTAIATMENLLHVFQAL
jgi:hypothetical protein